MLPITPTKSSDGVENIKKSLAARWGLQFPPRDSSPSRRDPHTIEEKIHNCLNYLFWRQGFDAGALDYALSQFERQAPAVASKWVFKPKADTDVLPSQKLQDSKLINDFLHTRPNLSKIQMNEMMVCLHEKLNEVADLVKNGQSYIQPPVEVMSSIEAVGNQPSNHLSRHAVGPQQPHTQKKLTQWFRSQSAPNPSLVDEYSDGETEDLFKDIDIRNMGVSPSLLSETILKPPQSCTPAENSPETEEFRTPPTTPLRESTRDLDTATFKKPSTSSFSRKRSYLDPHNPVGSRKSSRGSSSYSPAGLTQHEKSGSFSSISLESPSTSFGMENATLVTSLSSSVTTASSAFTSPNTSFSTVFSADSRSTSFDHSSEDTDNTIHAPQSKEECQTLVTKGTGKDSFPKVPDVAISPEDRALEASILNRLEKHPPFGSNIPERYCRLPFRQLYEILRVSLSSQVDFEQFRRALETEYADYDGLWTILNSVVKAHNCTMPERSSLAAWEDNRHTFDEVSLGGKLRYVDDNSHGPILRFTLSPLRLESSYRLSRQFGNDRFCIVTFPGVNAGDLPQSLRRNPLVARKALIDWLVGSHHFLGRTWRVFHRKEDRPRASRLGSDTPGGNRHKIYLFAEDGHAFRRSPLVGETDPRQPKEPQMLAREDILEWFMPAVPNQNQPALKLFKRLDLAVSKTTPTITFGPNEIYRSDDTYAHDPQPREIGHKRSDEKKRGVGTKKINSPVMNDGCARISKAAAREVADYLDLDQVPCAFQGRIGGAKGMWLVNSLEDVIVKSQDKTPQSTDIGYWIEITDSQLKFESHPLDAIYPEKNRVTFEVNDYPRKLTSSSLSFQLMPILENRGVPAEVFMDLLRADLTAKVGELQSTMESGLSLRLWNQRSNPVAEERAKFGGIEFQGGLPLSMAEKINWFVEHGFEPKSCRFLKEMLYQAILAYCLRLEAKMDVRVGQSAYVFMLADPLGILQEGQIHLCFSGCFYDKTSGFDEAMLHDRDYLVARSPAHLPSDIQKVRAVFKPELRSYRDVIIFPTKGTISLATMLSGGDYDGDKAWVCWEPSIVDPFTNATSLPEQPSIEKYGITKDATRTLDLMEHNRLNTSFIRHGLDFNLRFSMLGTCSQYHEAYCYKQTIDKPEAIEIASLLGLLVDSAKGGFVFDETKWNAYLKMRNLPPILQKPAYKDRGKSKRTNHLIDRLVFDIAKNIREETLGHFSTRLGDVGSWDYDLIRLRNNEIEAAKTNAELNEVLHNLELELEKVFNYWRIHARTEADESDYANPKKQTTDGMTFRALVESCRMSFLAIPPMADINRAIPSDRIREWQDQCRQELPSYWNLLKASVAFHKYHSKKFVWHMAGLELGEIKVKSTGCRSIVNGIVDVMKVDGKTVDGIKRREDFEDDGLNGDGDEFGAWDWAEEI